ncbi:small nucleolar ribonucleoprotein complex subunit [Diaporthe helianthi]|uniref:Small nucleolar ribonucleoprotein complex subunit n=1 Tax=Diaporthe helianthi TaxID=158607 RepID=A0A2P5HF16_DIAHE|nr:small nucleolar ribonucleoprotein complex subunit [Diaporthe helianthi]
MSRKAQDPVYDERSSENEDDLSSSFGEGGTPSKSTEQMDVDEADSDEEELERLVLGNKAGFRENLLRHAEDAGDGEALKSLGLDDGRHAPGAIGHEDLDDSALFMFDTGSAPAQGKQPTEMPRHAANDDGPQPAWLDSDDEKLAVSLAGVKQLRKLRESDADDLIGGVEYTRRLRQYYLRLNPLPSWAIDSSEQRKTKRRKRSSAVSDGSDTSSGSEPSGDEEDISALPLERFLRDAGALHGEGGRRKKRKLRPEVIDIQRTRDIPDTHKGPVESISFHPQHPVLLSSSKSSILYLHHVDPSAHPTPNPQLTSVQVQSVPIRRSAFVHPNGDEIILAGRRRFFHSWNLSNGIVKKVTKIQGHQEEQKSMERFRLSPDGKHMALVATSRRGGGMLNIISLISMQWVAQARLDSRGGIADFSWWRDGQGITILGRDGQVGEWSLATRRAVGIWRDEGSIGGTVMALGGRDGPPEVGGDKWVALGSTSGVLNIYDRAELISKAPGGAVEVKPLPTPTRSLEQLTTPITVTAFSPDGQLLAFASQHKKDAFKLVHLPSCTVYRNWPTEQTPMGRVTAVALGRSKDTDVLVVGNDVGKIRMWEIRN